MMRQRQTIMKTLAAVAIAFGMQTPAQAQFGGLLKKAKQAVKEKVDDAKNSAKQQAQGVANGQVQQAQGQPGQTDQATQNYINQLQTQHDDEHSGDFEMKSDGSYWIWRTSGYGTRVYDGDKLLMGKYYPKERKIWLSSETFTIADDGKVYDGKGEWRAIIQKNRLVTCNAEAINIVEHGLPLGDDGRHQGGGLEPGEQPAAGPRLQLAGHLLRWRTVRPLRREVRLGAEQRGQEPSRPGGRQGDPRRLHRHLSGLERKVLQLETDRCLGQAGRTAGHQCQPKSGSGLGLPDVCKKIKKQRKMANT